MPNENRHTGWALTCPACNYHEGRPVEVWDGDRGEWVPGVIDGGGDLGGLGWVWSVKTEATVQGLPLTYGVPQSEQDRLLRRPQP